MDTYLARLLAQRSKRSTVELVLELADALREKLGRGEKLSPTERAALNYCLVSTCDGIEGVISESPESIGITAEFAKKRGLKENARILGDAAKGKPVAGPVTFAAKIAGKVLPFDVPMGNWGATDIAMSLVDEDLDGAILDFVGENASDFAVQAPGAVAERDQRDDATSRLAATKSALILMDELLAHRKPRIRAQLREDERTGKPIDWLEVPVKHRSNGPANAKVIENLRRQYGAVANELLDLYAQHDGCDLFVADGNAGFMFAPIEEWPAHLDRVMEWSRDVTWADEPDELPDYLETSIPFGWQDGDSERWILVTQGRHAGRVMLSDTDSIDDEPRFQSVGEVIASLTLDASRIVGCGGYVSYGQGKYAGMYYPEEYIHD